jgi:hypothetical protein
MVHNSGQVGVGEGDTSEGAAPHQLGRGGLTILAKEEAGLWRKIGMPSGSE